MSLRFFVDQCVPRIVYETLREAGYDAQLLRDHLPTDAPDERVIARAQEIGAILITLDGDFANIINYPPADYGGIVGLQVRNHPENLPAMLMRLATYLRDNPEQAHYAGKLILVEAHRIRIKE